MPSFWNEGLVSLLPPAKCQGAAGVATRACPYFPLVLLVTLGHTALATGAETPKVNTCTSGGQDCSQ